MFESELADLKSPRYREIRVWSQSLCCSQLYNFYKVALDIYEPFTYVGREQFQPGLSDCLSAQDRSITFELLKVQILF